MSNVDGVETKQRSKEVTKDANRCGLSAQAAAQQTDEN